MLHELVHNVRGPHDRSAIDMLAWYISDASVTPRSQACAGLVDIRARLTIDLSPCSNSVFYKLLDELWTECEDLMDRGISGTGSGFDGPSSGRLGSHAFIPQHNPDPRLMREAALKVGGAAAQGYCRIPTLDVGNATGSPSILLRILVRSSLLPSLIKAKRSGLLLNPSPGRGGAMQEAASDGFRSPTSGGGSLGNGSA